MKAANSEIQAPAVRNPDYFVFYHQVMVTGYGPVRSLDVCCIFPLENARGKAAFFVLPGWQKTLHARAAQEVGWSSYRPAWWLNTALSAKEASWYSASPSRECRRDAGCCACCLSAASCCPAPRASVGCLSRDSFKNSFLVPMQSAAWCKAECFT